MAKNERKRTMVYSNVNKKADKKSASKNNDIINLDNEIVIGLNPLPKPKEIAKKQKKEKDKKKNKKIKKQIEKEKVDYNSLFQDDINEKGKNKKDKKISVESKINKKIDSNQKAKNKTNSNQKVNNKNEFDSKIANNQSEKNVKQQSSNSKIGQAKNNQKSIAIQQKIKMQKRRAIKRMATFFLLLILLIGAFVYFLLSPVFNVKTIEVVNNANITTEQITNVSGISINENMFKFSKKEVKKNILSNPYIEDAKISRKIFSNKVQIDVKERNATLMLEYGNSYVYINNQGYILEISPIKLDTPILKGYVTPLEEVKPGNRLNKEDLERLDTVLKILEVAETKEIANLITQINIQNKKNYIVVLESEDKTVYLGECSDLSTQMLYIKEMIKREKNIEGEFFVNMDLNTTNPVFREKV